jgi:nicotinate phosphoribosyltransferase
MADPEFNIWPAVLMGETADVYFQRTATVLRNESINPVVSMEFFPQRSGIICGVKEVVSLLERLLPKNVSEVWALEEGEEVAAREVALRIKAPYSSFGVYETAICGILSQCTAWATAARECVQAAGGVPVISFGAQHIHPNVAHIMDYSAVVGGCTSCSTALGAKLADVTPAGSMSHAYIICVGDLVKAAHLFDKHLPPDVPRMALVDTFKDEVEESLRVAGALRDKLRAVRLDTPVERGHVTPELVAEVRAHLDLQGFKQVGIFISGGLTPERLRGFVEAGAPVDGFGVGGAITSAPPNNFTADIHEVEGHPVAMRGRIPGLTDNPRLKQLL